METRAHHIVIGLFTLLTLLAAVAFSLWMAQASVQREYAYYEVVFNRAVSGLNAGSRIEFSGLEVGNVVEMRLSPDDPRQVLALIRVDQGVPIREDTQARLGLANITGSMTLQLSGGSPDSPRLETTQQAPAQITAAPSPIDSLLSDGEAVVSNVSQLLSNLNTLFEEESTQRINRIIANTEAITAGIADVQPQVAQSLEELDSLLAQASRSLQQFDTLSQSANQLLVEDGSALMQSANQTANNLNATTLTLQQMLTDNAPALENTLHNMETGSQALPDILQELQTTLENLNRITRRLEDNPGEFIFGGDAIQEFRP
ncbi:MlaD family protein [Halomonas sp. LS-001]